MAASSYKRIFRVPSPTTSQHSDQGGDAADPLGYVFTDRIELAVNVALAAQRPLLVRGAPGSGKSSLAAAVATATKAALIPYVVTSSTRARDLLWTFDAVRRLHDAQAHASLDDSKRYVQPGPLWWALDPETASAYQSPPQGDFVSRDRAIILLDEIDKADPDVPNDLLVPLGLLTFQVTDGEGLTVVNRRSEPPLIVLTTNEERDLPPAFIRRCVVLCLDRPDQERLVTIAKTHFGSGDTELYRQVAMLMEGYRDGGDQAHRPGTAEYLDAVRACRELEIRPDAPGWSQVEEFALLKWSAPNDSRT